MNLKQTTLAVAVVTALGLGMSSCSSQDKKDAAAKSKIEMLVPGVTVEVKDGVATIKGEMNEASKSAAEKAIKGVEGVTTVVNEIKVSASETMTAVTVNPDQTLIDATASLLKEFPGVNAVIKDGVISLTGEMKKMDWMKLKPMLDALHPRKVTNAMTIK